jgi:hypothetical protein
MVAAFFCSMLINMKKGKIANNNNERTMLYALVLISQSYTSFAQDTQVAFDKLPLSISV